MNWRTIILFGKRLVFFLVLWIILAEAAWRDPLVAGLGVVAAALCSMFLWPPKMIAIRWQGVPALMLYFVCSSIKGGVDIARRAVSPAMPLRTGFIEFKSRLSGEGALVFFAWTISLMPGTACIQYKAGGNLVVHVVDSATYDEEALRRLEALIRRCLQPVAAKQADNEGDL